MWRAIGLPMDSRWLVDFLTLAETGSFTQAAKLRCVSQAAFSRRIRTLEARLRLTLVDRTTAPAQLTAEGQVFREQAAEIVQQIAEARTSLGGADPARREQIRVALAYSLASGALPGWWSAWTKAAGPDILVSVVTGNLPDSMAALTTAAAEVLVCMQSEGAPVTLAADQYEHRVIGRETVAPYVAASRYAQLRGVFPGSKAHPLPLLMYTRRSSLSRVVDSILAAGPEKLTTTMAFEAETSAVLRAMAIAGHGVAWLPECVAREAPAGALRPLQSSGWSAALNVVAYRDRSAGSPALERLWAALPAGIA